MKCKVCGKEADLPFRCSYCQGYFCVDHKLPENHQCPDLPKEPLFWYHKKQKLDKLTARGRDSCPKCGSTFIGVLSFDKEKENIRCQTCGYEWRQPRSIQIYQKLIPSTHPRETKPKKPTGKGSIKDTLLGLLLGFIITLVGLGIIIWELYNPLFWTIIFVWFIPIPMILIGGFLAVLGIIIAIGSVTTFVSSLPQIEKIVALLLIVIILSVFLWNAQSIISFLSRITGFQPYIGQPSSTTPPSNLTQPSVYPYEELVNYALSLINKDRMNHGRSNVSLSEVNSGQKHAENMLKHQFFSHWDTNGYKPYMRYTLVGGQGSVAENIAWQYSNVPFDLKEAIMSLEWQMMYNDSEWNWGHRDNILNPFHNKVSLGIAYDDNNLYLVQDFENNYINWSTMSIAQTGEVEMSGTFEKEKLSAEWINIFYDPLPSKLTSEQLKKLAYSGGYGLGTFVGMVVSQGYESPEGITITAQTWVQTGNTFQIRFNLSPAFNVHGKGVYTLYLQPDPEITEDSLTSYSFWHY